MNLRHLDLTVLNPTPHQVLGPCSLKRFSCVQIHMGYRLVTKGLGVKIQEKIGCEVEGICLRTLCRVPFLTVLRHGNEDLSHRQI